MWEGEGISGHQLGGNKWKGLKNNGIGAQLRAARSELLLITWIIVVSPIARKGFIRNEHIHIYCTYTHHPCNLNFFHTIIGTFQTAFHQG
jgi:hypothetical protein